MFSVKSIACYAQTRKVMKYTYSSRIAPQKAHKQCLLKPKSVTLFRFSQNIKLQTIYRFKVLILQPFSVIMIAVPLILFWYCHNLKPKIIGRIAVKDVSKTANTKLICLVLKWIKRMGIICNSICIICNSRQC